MEVIEREPLVADEDGAVWRLVPVAAEDLGDGRHLARQRRRLGAESRLLGDDGAEAIAERW